MKRKSFLAVTLAVSMTAALSVGALAATKVTANYIGEERAKAIALESAGLTAEQTTLISARLDRDDGHNVYDVNFYTYNTEYDYEIDAVSGEIWEYSYDIDYRITEDGTMLTVQTAGAGAAAQYISEAEAKAIALEAAGFTETQVPRIGVDLDREHGTMVYEVEFREGFTEYDYEINAVDGMLLKADVEYGD